MTNFQDRYLMENRRLNELAGRRLGASIEQPIDPDGPAMPCGEASCRRDAVRIIRVNAGTPAEYGLTACMRHIATMRQALMGRVS